MVAVVFELLFAMASLAAFYKACLLSWFFFDSGSFWNKRGFRAHAKGLAVTLSIAIVTWVAMQVFLSE